MIDDKVWEGVNSLLDNYAEIQPEDVVVVGYTSDSHECAAWVSTALKTRGISAKRVWMAPLHDTGFADRFASVLPPALPQSGRLVILTFERDSMSHTSKVSAALSRFDKNRCAVLRAISAGPEFFSDGLRASPQAISARNAAILERLMPAKKLRIKSPGGTDLNVVLDSNRHTWISNRGVPRPGRVVILPAGEVATYPASIEGVLVADFAFNANLITDRDARLQKHPVTVWIEQGRAVRHECSDPDTSLFVDECFRTHCSHNVGELGFGTNFGASTGIAMNSHVNERCPGVHLGFGQHNQDSAVVGYDCTIHLDLIARGGLVWVDDDPTPLDLENIIPSSRAHTANFTDEDVFSPELDDLTVDDCCGILTREGIQLFAAQPS
jgi:hypothetical protein